MANGQRVGGTIRRGVISLIVCTALLQGCATAPATDAALAASPVANEPLLKAAGNHAGLIELYKARLKSASDVQMADSNRYLLGETYLEANDPESALFYINPVIDEGRGDASTLLLQSRALHMMGQQDKALRAALNAIKSDPENPRTANQLGVIYADMGDFSQAREFFNKARQGMLADVIVMNNLAMVDILEQNYRSAVDRLMPLYNTGQADDRITANLVVALVRGQMYDEFTSVYTGTRSEEERIALFRAISQMEPRRLSTPEESL